MIKKKTIYLAMPRGFCAGVDRAIESLNHILKTVNEPIYVNHEIVHNKSIVSNFESKGVVFSDNIEEIPEKAVFVISAHGTSPELIQKAISKNLKVVDVTCPLVNKVHVQVGRLRLENNYIVYIGHKNHPEAIGVLGEATEFITIVENEKDITELKYHSSDNIAYLTQTTLSIDDTKNLVELLKKKYPQISGPAKSDICYATTNRQGALFDIIDKVEKVIVVGSPNSSNSNRLREKAELSQTPAILIDYPNEIDEKFLEGVNNIGVTSGASVPEELVDRVVNYLRENFDFTDVIENNSKTENVNFKLANFDSLSSE